MRRVLAAAGLILLAGCSSGPSLTAGHVVGRAYDPAYTWVQMIPITTEDCISVGTSEDCTTLVTGYIPVEWYQPEDWRLLLKDGKLTGWTYVTQDQFLRARTGQWWGSRDAARPAASQGYKGRARSHV